MIRSIEANHLNHIDFSDQKHTIYLESGHIIYLPQLSFKIEDSDLLSPKVCDTQKKNISFDYQQQKLAGISKYNPYQNQLKIMMEAYALYARSIVDTILPEYQSALRWGRTSYRPVEIIGRQRSKRQDDTRIHVDAFPATPVQGWRILRVFCNVNPNNKPREWNLGEPFSQLLPKFSAQLPSYSPFKAWLLKQFKITKSLRTAYDHYMLHLHDQMKLSDQYQKNLLKTPMDFAAQSTWVVFTDVVSHAALSGQYLLEQTFYLPIAAMVDPNLSPYKQLQMRNLI